MLTVRNLGHTYTNGTRALSSIDLEIPKGMFGLLGPNGAGKSTLMRSIATLQTPTEGSIHFGDIDVLREPEKLRARLGYLPQDFGVYPRVSARGLLDHIAVLKGIADRGERRDTVETLLAQVNLWDVRDKAVAGFSGGMRQRFGIAQALIGRPELIIVDEPTAGLDPEERNRFNNLLVEIGENVVIILSTHIVDDVSDLCTRMAVINAGRVLLDGSPQDLMRTIEGRIWRSTIMPAALADYQSNHQVLAQRLRAGRLLIHVLADTRPGHEFEPVEASLEDLYFATLAASRTNSSASAAA
jgi:ABC-type multidrug transport system ATPase subunit